MTVKKGDLVQVISGKHRGKRGKVERVLPKENKVVIGGVALVKRHLKPSRKHPKGGIVEVEAAIHRSKVMPVCPETKKPTRVRTKVLGGVKTRISQYGDISLDTKN